MVVQSGFIVCHSPPHSLHLPSRGTPAVVGPTLGGSPQQHSTFTLRQVHLPIPTDLGLAEAAMQLTFGTLQKRK